jgi:acetylornithine deacetylase/succinyl-diaminopimelate desuccinylase-like protein
LRGRYKIQLLHERQLFGGVAGIPTIGFGPGAEDGAHVRNENIEILQVKQAAVGYQAIAAKFLCK